MQVLKTRILPDARYWHLSWWIRDNEAICSHASWLELWRLLWRDWGRFNPKQWWCWRIFDSSSVVLWVQARSHPWQGMWVVLWICFRASRCLFHVSMESYKRRSTWCFFQKCEQFWDSNMRWSQWVLGWRSYHVPPDLYQNLRKVQTCICTRCQSFHWCST